MGQSLSTPVAGSPSQILLQLAIEGDLEGLKKQIGISITETSDAASIVNAADAQGNAALHGCTFAGHLEVVRFLVEQCHADATLKNGMGCSPLWLAAGYGHAAILGYLLAHQRSTNGETTNTVETNNTGDSPVLAAASKGHVECVRMLLEGMERMVACQSNGSGDTPLAAAISAGHGEVFELLLEYDVSNKEEDSKMANQRNKHGLTPLHIACERNNTPVVEKLLESDAKIQTDGDGSSPLAVAALCGCDDAVQALLKHEAGKRMLNVQNDKGCTPLWLASTVGSASTVQILLASGADPSLADTGGLTSRSGSQI